MVHLSGRRCGKRGLLFHPRSFRSTTDTSWNRPTPFPSNTPDISSRIEQLVVGKLSSSIYDRLFFRRRTRFKSFSTKNCKNSLSSSSIRTILSFNFLNFFPSRSQNFSIPFHSNQRSLLRKKVNERYAEKKERKRYLPKQEANQELNVRFHQTNDDQKINRYYRNRNGVYNRNTRRGELLTRLTFEIRNVHDEARACMINDCMGNLEGAIRTLAWLRRGHKPEAAIQGPGRARCE